MIPPGRHSINSHEGQAIRFNEEEVRPMGRTARGVRAMDLAEGDYLVGTEVVEKEGHSLDLGTGLRQANAASGLPPPRTAAARASST